MIHVKTFLGSLGAAVWLLASTGMAEPGAASSPTTPVKVPAAIQDILGGDTSKSHVSPEEGALVIIGMVRVVEKQSILNLVRATRALAQSPEFQAHKNLHGWILRIEDEGEQIVALFVDPWKLDWLTGLSDGDFLMVVGGIYAFIGGQLENYQLFLGDPPHQRVERHLEERKRLIETLGLEESMKRQQGIDSFYRTGRRPAWDVADPGTTRG